jgi:cell division protein ZapE
VSNFYKRYQALMAQGELQPDADQEACAQRLSRLQEELEAMPQRGSLLRRTFGKKPSAPKGVYMWGGVGRGKSMLMDLFYDNLRIDRKKRAHFHEFMLDVHDRIREERKKERGDPILPVATALASEARFLAFDEMVVNNSADAMIMSPTARPMICTRMVSTENISCRSSSCSRRGSTYFHLMGRPITGANGWVA